MPPLMLRGVGLFNATVRELLEMQYQFEEPFIVDSSKMTTKLGVQATPIDQALADTLATYVTSVSSGKLARPDSVSRKHVKETSGRVAPWPAAPSSSPVAPAASARQPRSGLAAMGARVAITGRDPARTDAAAREIRAAHGGEVMTFVADLSAQSEVRRLADEVQHALPRIDVLVNNVGGYWNTRRVTVDGLEYTFALNHLAPFLLTNLLVERLKQSAPARVVTVASNAHALGRIDFDDLQGEQSYSGARAYNQSKLANVLFTYELARRLGPAGVTANALHPGVVNTSFGAADPAGVQRWLVPILRPFMKSPARGCCHLHPPGDVARSGAGDGPVLREPRGQAVLAAQLRRGHRDPAVASEPTIAPLGRHLLGRDRPIALRAICVTGGLGRQSALGRNDAGWCRPWPERVELAR